MELRSRSMGGMRVKTMARRGGCGGDGERNKNAAMTPVKEMAFAEAVEVRRRKGGAGVEEAVRDIDGPDGEGEQSGHPEGQADVRYPGEGERPDEGDGGCVEAGQVPEAQWGGRVEGDRGLRLDARVGKIVAALLLL